MDLPNPQQALAALAAFVRERLNAVSDTVTDTLGPLVGPWSRPEEMPAAARQLATAIVGAAAPFATTSYARARLLRQMHACGLLSEDEVPQADAALASDTEATG